MEEDARPLALVLGAGAQGLACTLRLWERGWNVLVCAHCWLQQTTSSGAGAIWEYPPFEVQPQENARRWVLQSLPAFAAAMCAGGSTRSGVRIGRSYYLFRSRQRALERYGPLEAWSSEVPHFLEGPPPPGLAREGTFEYSFSYMAPVLNMRRYLGWLTECLGALPGIQMRSRRLADAAEVSAMAASVGADVVVNCLGLGARDVFGDLALYGVRGDLAYVLAPGAEARFGYAHVSDEDDPDGHLTYAVAQGDGVVAAAGTMRRLCAEELEGGYSPKEDALADAEVASLLVARSAAMLPGAVHAATAQSHGGAPIVVGQWSGARPQREGGVRLEREQLLLAGHAAVWVVHNYGHGGSGVVTSWGCASQVCSLAAESLAQIAAGDGPAAVGHPVRRLLRVRALPASLAPLAIASLDTVGGAALRRASEEDAKLRARHGVAARSAL